MNYSTKLKRKYNNDSNVHFRYELHRKVRKHKNEKRYPIYFQCKEDGKGYYRRSIIFDGYYQNLSDVDPLHEIELIIQFAQNYLEKGHDFVIDLALDDLKAWKQSQSQKH
jgi:hypothetical protein